MPSEHDEKLVDQFIDLLQSWRHSRNEVQGYKLDLRDLIDHIANGGANVRSVSSNDLMRYLAKFSSEDPFIQYRKASAIRQFFTFLVAEVRVRSDDPSAGMLTPNPGDLLLDDVFRRGNMVRFTFSDETTDGAVEPFEGILTGFRRDAGIRKAEFITLADGVPTGERLIDLENVVEIEAAGPPLRQLGAGGSEKYMLEFSLIDQTIKPAEVFTDEGSFLSVDKIAPPPAATPAPAAPASTTDDSPETRLQKIRDLEARGLITPGEAEEKRKQILESL